MAAVEKMEYPHTGGVTNTFQPSLDAFLDGSGEDYDQGVIPAQSMGKREYRYEEGIQLREIRRAFRMMTSTDKSDFMAFLAVVGGLQFKFTDWLSVAHVVTFKEFKFNFRPREGVLWDFDVVMREEL